MNDDAIIRLQDAVIRLSSAVTQTGESITALASASGRHSAGLLAAHVAIMALLEDAAQDPQRAARLRETLSRLVEENQVRLLYAEAADDLMEQLRNVLNGLLPPQMQPL